MQTGGLDHGLPQGHGVKRPPVDLVDVDPVADGGRQIGVLPGCQLHGLDVGHRAGLARSH